MERECIIKLVKDVQEGSAAAFSTLFEAYKNDVYSIAIRETKDRILSDDIVQETFIEVLQKINDLKNPGAFPSWLKIMAYHQCTRYYKKKETVHETGTLENEDGWSVFDTMEETNASFIPDEALDRKEFKETIVEMIDQLPDTQRAALYMFYFEEMPLKVIAKVQGVSINTANTRLNRGRLAIKDSVEKYEKKHGIRLHSIAFFPLFNWLLKGTEEVMPKKSAAQVAQRISSRTGTAISGTRTMVASGTGSIGASGAGTAGIFTKAVAGVLAATIAVGGVAVFRDNRDQDVSVATTVHTEAIVETSEFVAEDVTVTVDSLEEVYRSYEAFLAAGFSQEGLEINYYTYLDIDQDGVPELIVADNDGTPDSWTICEVYTYRDGEMAFCGHSNSRYDYLYYVNGKYLLVKHRMGNQFISTDGYFYTYLYHWDEGMTCNDPIISFDDGTWEWLTEEKFQYYQAETGGFIETMEVIVLQKNNLKTS